ncbi:alpha/beta hydrolase [Paenibacillus abyssi]|uniref:Alpha/beta hydrolase n=2 Tax=Paenibacillus abyssi TaxID=1340531 RepID=A0A917D5F6_9BACL|nr:alpha/beta hydrolase [Paenibacillus abyssi]
MMNGPRCVFMDLPAHGSNDAPMMHTIKDHANYLKPLITDKTIVIGHSMGGLIGIELAANHPKVVGLVLAASHYVLPVDSTLFDKLESGVYPNGLFYASYSKEADKALLEEERSELSIVPLETTIIDYRCCNDYGNGKECLSHIQKPILAIYGQDDRMLPSKASEELKRLAPHAVTEVIPQAGHYVMLERSEHFVNALLQFVQHISERR